jgi:hypothetical protein
MDASALSRSLFWSVLTTNFSSPSALHRSLRRCWPFQQEHHYSLGSFSESEQYNTVNQLISSGDSDSFVVLVSRAWRSVLPAVQESVVQRCLAALQEPAPFERARPPHFAASDKALRFWLSLLPELCCHEGERTRLILALSGYLSALHRGGRRGRAGVLPAF